MAVNFFTIEGVSDVAKEGEKALNVLSLTNSLDTDILVQQAISHIQDKIDQLVKSEQHFLNHFDCSTIGEFKSRVNKYYSSYNLINYTGFSLRKYTNEYNALTSKSKEQLANDMNTILYNLFERELSTNGQVGQELEKVFEGKEISEASAELIVSLLIEELSKFGVGTLQSTKFFTLTSAIDAPKAKKADRTYFFKLCADLTTKAFRRNIGTLKQVAKGELKEITGKAGKTGKTTVVKVDNDLINRAQQLIKVNEKTQKIATASMEQTFVIDWSDLIKAATHDNSGRASELKYDKDSAELQEINTKITEMIIADYGINESFKTYARQKITDMWLQDPTMFFIGSATTKLTGVLGEINAMIALSDLLGKKFTEDIIHWVGSDSSGGKQPSVDIALSEIGKFSYGIQVKNTATDLKADISHFIGFADKSVESILDSLGIPSGAEAIENVYTSDVFNVPYKVEGTKYVQVGYNTAFDHDSAEAERFHEYVEVDKRIDEIVKNINLYLTRFASDFLYIGFENDKSGFKSALAALDAETVSLSGNFVYIVGKEVFFASEMLEELKEQLNSLKELEKKEEQMNFKIEAYFGDLKSDVNSDFNIVSKLNSGGSLGAHTIKLRSSWGFHT